MGLQSRLDSSHGKIPVVEDHCGARAKTVKLLDRYSAVFSTVLLEPGDVISLPIDLIGDTFVNEEIDRFEFTEGNLRNDGVPAQTKPSARETLRKAVASVVHPIADGSTIHGESEQYLLPLDRVDRVGAKCPVDGGHRGFEIFVQNHTNESIR